MERTSLQPSRFTQYIRTYSNQRLEWLAIDSFKDALHSLSAGLPPNEEYIVALLSAGTEQMPELLSAADRMRRREVGEAVHLRAIIEFSNFCRKNCLYCGLRRDNRSLPRYRLTEQQILDAAGEAAVLGFRTVVLQSGEDPYYRPADIARVVEKIKSSCDLAVTLSLGEHSRQTYKIWREAGADRYLLKQETADERLFKYLKPDTSLSKRVQCLCWLKELGYQTGSGNMVGLPGQSLHTLAQDIMLMQELDVDMAGIGPFLPHPATPLKDAAPGGLELTLKTLALTRICLPQAHLPATTALCTLTTDGRRMALSGGANVIMPNLTPPAVRSKYLIYPQKADISEKPAVALAEITALLAEMGRPLASGPGHATKTNRKSFFTDDKSDK
ncbi:[FeFe] hydrogenase H-cluster radical SAM maturase HydE [Desulfoscipio gibsoniae]|uniref:Iron-only hydrogenase maturation rSAM protein HydE n=1 Tax=Desulfoscipio gibsoniae DSM 7213 TaxID=767817 RepID=R4KFM9_9FIRM|nr:iron-only hydrogenase maturation rSAM protein HydE [Desulfoscipio gibsoniae DSM 7213]